MNVYIFKDLTKYMIGQGLLNMMTVVFMSFMEGFDFNPEYILAMLVQALTMVLAIIALIVLLVLQLLGIIPNPWPWMM
jgi:Kef-type K+ transport system membrane component KefB